MINSLEKEAANVELVSSTIDFMLRDRETSPPPCTAVNMIFITRDEDFTKNLAELRRRNCNIVVVIASILFLHPTLAQNVDVI
jgi:hypothetical protein